MQRQPHTLPSSANHLFVFVCKFIAHFLVCVCVFSMCATAYVCRSEDSCGYPSPLSMWGLEVVFRLGGKCLYPLRNLSRCFGGVCVRSALGMKLTKFSKLDVSELQGPPVCLSSEGLQTHT